MTSQDPWVGGERGLMETPVLRRMCPLKRTSETIPSPDQCHSAEAPLCHPFASKRKLHGKAAVISHCQWPLWLQRTLSLLSPFFPPTPMVYDTCNLQSLLSTDNTGQIIRIKGWAAIRSILNTKKKKKKAAKGSVSDTSPPICNISMSASVCHKH